MEQHPVPQQISSYEFHLVGDMTLKQFFQLSGGALVSLLFYASNLPGIVKWPLVLFFALVGVALAFLPLEERPLSTWAVAFIKAIYSPTKYEYKPGAAEDVFAGALEKKEEPVIIAPKGLEEAEKYLSEIPHPRVWKAFEEVEASFLKSVTAGFQAGEGTPRPQEVFIPQPPAPPQKLTPSAEDIYMGPRPQAPQKPPQEKPPTQEVEKQPAPQTPTPSSEPRSPAAQAVFDVGAAPPLPPERPNIVIGQVLDKEGKTVEGAILEIKDAEGAPVRALKTNKVGHFMTATPLQNGAYEIEIEKEGLQFEPIKFGTEGRIIPPIQIRAKGVAKEGNEAS